MTVPIGCPKARGEILVWIYVGWWVGRMELRCAGAWKIGTGGSSCDLF
jgi:hypothetical protein